MSPDDEAVRRALDRYGLADAEVSPLGKGHSNRQFLVTAGEDHCVLRCYSLPGESGWNRRCRSRENIQYEHDVLAFAAGRGFPCLPPIPAGNGGTLTQIGERFYALSPHRAAETYRRDDAAAVAAAALLGRFHGIMAGFPERAQRPGRGLKPRLADWFHACETGLGRAEEIAEWALAMPQETETQQYLAANAPVLADALRVLREEFPAEVYGELPCVVNHGDYHYSNLGCEGGEIVVVYDFDDCALDLPMLDLSHLLWLCGNRREPVASLDLARRMVASYRQQGGVSARELSLFPYFAIADIVHLPLGLYGIVRQRPDADVKWLASAHMEPLRAYLEARTELAERFRRF